MITLFLVCAAGALYGVLQSLAWHFDNSIFSNAAKFNQHWWNPNLSYANKNKHNATKPPFEEKFFGSRTFLAWTTDAFHLIDKMFLTALFMALVLYTPWCGVFYDFCIYYFAFTICFEGVWRLVHKPETEK